MNQEKKLVNISDIVDNQIPEFIADENPNFVEFLKQYYISQEYQGGVVNLAENLSDYKNFSAFNSDNLIASTTLSEDVEFFDDVVYVGSTKGWPASYGLLKINNEIITYTGITTNSFTGCIRGFSGVESLEQENNPEFLVFTSTESNSHLQNDVVYNLSNLFLIEFFDKIKYQFAPGFEEIDFDPKINPQNFISKVKTFYQSKGTDEAFKILFKVLYDENVQILKPKDFCFTSSDDQWVVTETFVCDLISGDPYKISGQTLYQDPDPYNENIFAASGSIYGVGSFKLEDKILYKVRIFAGYSNNLNPKGSISGTFVPTFKTYVVEDVEIGSNSIIVDSTVGYPQQGRIIINGNDYEYTDKTNNQFLNVVSLGSTSINNSILRKTEVYSTNYVYSYEDGDATKLVILRLNNVLSSVTSEETLYSLEQDPIKVENIGYTTNNVFVKSLLYNHPISIYTGKAVNLITSPIRSYNKEGFAITNGLALSKYDHNLKTGDTVNLFVKEIGKYNLKISNLSVTSNLAKEFSTQQFNDTSILGKDVLFRRNLKKTKCIPFTKLYNNIQNKYTANIQDSYEDSNYYYLTSNGLPDYEVNPYIKEFSFVPEQFGNNTFSGSHNFYTGEAVKVVGYGITGEFRNDIGINTGTTYFITRNGPNIIGLSENRESVENTLVNFIEYDAINNYSGRIDSLTLISSPLYGNDFSSSKLFKKLPKNISFDKKKVPTPQGPVGIFKNGVEIQNYKSFDQIYYGQIDTVDVLNPGKDYSLINPPRFEIFNNIDDEDTETFLIPQMKGVLKNLSIINPGYDYEDTPTVTIVGGNNKEVTTQVKMKNIYKEVLFNATTRDTVVNTVDNEFRFGKIHGLQTGEAIVYETFGSFPIGIGTIVSDGTMQNNGVYYAVNIGAGTSIKIAPTKNDALQGTNLINLRTTGGGLQNFKSLTKIQIVDSVTILGSNIEFEYKKLSFAPEDINIYDNIFTHEDHGYVNGDKVTVSADGSQLGGTTLNQIYYVDKLDSDNFRLCTDSSLKNVLDITSTDFATSYFVQFLPITVKIDGKIKTTSSAVIGYGATIIPIVEGYITNVRVQRGLAKPAKQLLGSSTVVNYHKHPIVNVLEGYDAEFAPIITDGKIIQIIVKNSGNDYYNNFELKVNGQGYGAVLSPQISDGKIINVDVVSSGVGYASTDTIIEIVTKGQDLKVKANLTTWTLNEVTKLGVSNISNGALLGKRYSLFGNVYGVFYLTSNLLNSFGIKTGRHSPIIGWSYDGCPIYGPFAYENSNGTGNIIRMVSGYIKNKISPSPFVECIEDYTFANTGTLDEHNGRFCITPEYPNGIYAYFCTVDENNAPVFPYVIGNTYNYTPIQENFTLSHNQDLDFNKLGIIKHTKPYRVDDKENYYEYFKLLTTGNKPDAVITSSTSGKITSIDISDGGFDYEVGDKIEFVEDENEGLGAFAEVSKVSGVGIVSITSGITTFSDVYFLSIPTGIIGIATTAHNFSDQTYVSISGISTSDYNSLEGFRKINVEYPSTTLTVALPDTTVTGVVTSIQVKAPLENYRIDDKLTIQNETLNVIGVDYKNKFINVLRENGSPGYTVNTEVSNVVNKFTFAFDELDVPLVEYDETYYFNPIQSVSLGISTVAGVGNTLAVYPLGVGNSITKFVEHGGIFLPNHKFKNGEKVTYSSNASTIICNAGNLDSLPELYVIKLEPDVIGLVQNKTDINNRESILRYNANGTGILHKFTTVRDIVTGTITQCNVNVSTASTHGLSVGNNIEVNVISGITTTYNVGYSSITKRVTINSQINPKIDVYANEIIVFDTTDLSLVGKDFNLYTDETFGNPYFGNQTNGIEVIKTSTDLTLTISDYTPRSLYYNLTNITTNDSIYADTTVTNYNQLKIQDSLYEIQSKLIGVTDYTFTYNLPVFPEKTKYTNSLSTLNYSVLDSGIKGAIQSTNLIYGGANYKKLPEVKSITSTLGKGANLFAVSNSIGRIKDVKILNLETIFPTDKTLTPISKIFSTIKLKNNYTVGSLNITDVGSKYLTPPTLNLYNRTTDTVNTEFSAVVILKNSSANEISILNSGSNLKSTDNEIVVTNNTNGIKIINASVSGTGPYDVTLLLETPLSGFTTSNNLPIKIGDEIFVENIVSSNGTGFNTKNYKYLPFTVTFTNPNLNSQDSAVVRYQVPTFPGVFDEIDTYNANVIKYSDMIKVTPTLVKDEFYNNEYISDLEIIDNKLNAPITSLIKLHESTGLSEGNTIIGNSSKTKATISKIEDFQGVFKIDSSASEIVGWRDFRGNLSTILQKLQDNNYYQNFSYSLKSKKSFTDWNTIVSELAHISGYKQFGDLSVESELPVGIGSTLTVKSKFNSQVNVVITSEVDVNTISNFDIVLEEDIDDSEGTYSEYLKFGTKKLSDYILSSNNRVLSIDDISNLFNTDNSPLVNIPVDNVDTTDTIVLKYFFLAASTVSFFGDFVKPEVFDLFVTRNNTIIDLTSYGYYYDLYTPTGSANYPIGEITAQTSPTNGDEIIIGFTPRNIFNSYAIRAIKDVTTTTVGVATNAFGYVKSVEKTGIYTSTPSPSTDIFYSTPLSDCSSGVVCIGISSTPKRVESAYELSFVKDVNNVINVNVYAENGRTDLGVFDITTSANDIEFTFTPPVGLGVTLFTNLNLITNTYQSPNEIVNELSFVNSELLVASGSSPVSISTVPIAYAATKYIIEMQKTSGLTTERGLIQINSVHFQDYSNNTIFGIIGNLPIDQINFETIYNPSFGQYILTFNPTVSADYRFKILRKSILSPNQE
jgi:hypothetical protein